MISIERIKPFESLSKPYRKQNLNEKQINNFKRNLTILFEDCENAEKKGEHEEHFKNIASDFLKDTYFKGNHVINIEKRKDLVIHNDKTALSKVGVMIETKRPSNKGEMLAKDNANVKALQQLIYYYFQERDKNDNQEIKHLIITNIYEWYIFDATDFERLFWANRSLKDSYQKHSRGELVSKEDTWFYANIAKPFLENETGQLKATYVSLKEVEILLKNGDDNKLIDFYKILSAEHLLKKPFENDGNTLNKDFYNELLHILGLEESKDIGKKLIVRKAEGYRNEGSLLENAINLLKVNHKLANFDNLQAFGETEEEQLFSLGLELCITWLNRILFLKLLEGQLAKYHKNDPAYKFLNSVKIKDFDEINELFFEVLAVPIMQRTPSVTAKFGGLPYLNSSLFEQTEIETKTLLISHLKDRLTLPLFPNTVLKTEATDHKLTGQKITLQYLFAFLDAYNFESDSIAKIQKESKNVINAAVLGLIFEKINGYQDGSFFTPSFITMYMCRETLRRAVIAKFNKKYQWKCETFEDLYNKIDNITIEEANATINTLRICDPAVGSGHFLVSALNELISLKSELKILVDLEGKRLRGYDISAEDDELIIKDEGEHFTYTFKDKESGRVQEALFHEKQTLIENCLFGVDINPKSVMICRLRLWIELLKNMYYTSSSHYTELETLPNIDINIKTGNSLVYRFDIKDRYTKLANGALQKVKLATQKYKDQVFIYKSTNDKATKKLAEKNIADLKQTFSQIANPTDRDYIAIKKIEVKLGEMPMLFSREEQEAWKKEVETLTFELQKYKDSYNHKLKTLYANAFEWRFEFPEVLDENGQFEGFDAVIGNPPYIRQEKMATKYKDFYLSQFSNIGHSTADIYVYFFGLSLQIAKNEGLICFITLNKWLKRKYGINLRLTLDKLAVIHIIDFFELPVFDEASTDSAITLFQTAENTYQPKYYAIKSLKGLNLNNFVREGKYLGIEKSEEEWIFTDEGANLILQKLYTDTLTLKDYTNAHIYYGIKTGANDVFIISHSTKEIICKKDPKSAEIIAAYAKPRNLTKYAIEGELEWFINSHNGFLVSVTEWNKYKQEKNEKIYFPVKGHLIEILRIEKSGKHHFRLNRIDVKNDYPAVYEYFLTHEEKMRTRNDKGEHWTNLRNCDYIYTFESPKIIYLHTAKNHHFYFDTEGKLIDANGYFISTDKKYIWAYLNSPLFNWYRKIKFVAYGDADEAGRVRLDLNKMETVPIKPISEEMELIFNKKVDALLILKKSNPIADISKQEQELNAMIYELYNITAEEQKVIEGENKI